MRILDRYILKSIFGIFLGCLLAFFSLYIIIDVFSHLDEILKQSANLSLLLKYYLGYLPIIFVQVTPIACLLSTLYTFGHLNRNNEIIAMRAAGLSILEITKTVISFGIIASILVFWVNDKFVPRSLSLTQKIKNQMETQNLKIKEKEPEFVRYLYVLGLKNRLFSIDKFYPATNTMEGIIILEQDEEQNVIKKIIADKGVYINGLWTFYKCITYNYVQDQIIEEPKYREEEIMVIPETPAELLNQRQSPDFMTISELDSYIGKLSKSGALSVVKNFQVDLYHRYFFPLTSIIIIFLGIPFALRMKKRATGLSSVGLSILVGFSTRKSLFPNRKLSNISVLIQFI